jgi:hypothetical protein
LCGCGRQVKPGNKFVNRHNILVSCGRNEELRIERLRSVLSGRESPLKGTKRAMESRLKQSKSINGSKHWNWKGPKKIVKCECGCGELALPGNSYLHGHNSAVMERTKEHCSKISYALSEFYSDPTKHPNWRGGISAEPYCDAWLDRDYKDSIKERDGSCCMNSGCFGRCDYLQIHHIDYDKKNCHPWNLITLCASCNGRANKDRKHWAKFYQRIMSERYGYVYS